MELFPAIDLLDGQVVRLSQGEYDQKTTYSADPLEVAEQFVTAGASWVHIVDLDAARTGQPTNHEPIRRIAEQTELYIELGGGARNTDTIRQMLDELADRVVVGSAALKDWPWFESLLYDESIDNNRLALGLDARDGQLAIHGWTEVLADTPVDLARRVNSSGLGAIVYTDISRDGMMTGVNLEATRAVIDATDVPVSASGGIGKLEEILRCREIGCAGVVLGRALYEGKVDLTEAIARLADPSQA